MLELWGSWKKSKYLSPVRWIDIQIRITSWVWIRRGEDELGLSIFLLYFGTFMTRFIISCSLRKIIQTNGLKQQALGRITLKLLSTRKLNQNESSYLVGYRTWRKDFLTPLLNASKPFDRKWRRWEQIFCSSHAVHDVTLWKKKTTIKTYCWMKAMSGHCWHPQDWTWLRSG